MGTINWRLSYEMFLCHLFCLFAQCSPLSYCHARAWDSHSFSFLLSVAPSRLRLPMSHLNAFKLRFSSWLEIDVSTSLMCQINLDQSGGWRWYFLIKRKNIAHFYLLSAIIFVLKVNRAYEIWSTTSRSFEYNLDDFILKLLKNIKEERKMPLSFAYKLFAVP